MKRLLIFAILFATLFAFSGKSLAGPSPEAYHVEFIGMKEFYNVGDSIKIKVETATAGKITDVQLQVLPHTDSNKANEVTSLRTTHNQKKSTYETIGFFKTRTVDSYTVLFQATHDSFAGPKQIEASIIIHVKDPKQLIMHVSPHVSKVSVGQEVPILITYSSKYKVDFRFSEPVKDLMTLKGDGVFKKIVLFKAGEAKEYKLLITAHQDRILSQKSAIVTIEAE